MTTAPQKQSPPRHFDSPQQEAWLNLWRTYDRLRAAEEELFARYDLTPQQYNSLRLLRGEHPEGLPTLEIANRLVSRAPDITRLLDKLEARQLITRERSENDRRCVLVRITAEGLTLLRELDKPVRDCHAHQLGHMPPGDLQKLNDFLRAARAPHEPPNSHWS